MNNKKEKRDRDRDRKNSRLNGTFGQKRRQWPFSHFIIARAGHGLLTQFPFAILPGYKALKLKLAISVYLAGQGALGICLGPIVL